jgi:radical SAM-linked protein
VGLRSGAHGDYQGTIGFVRYHQERTQRLRLTFSKGEEIKYISHLDLMRLWERALRRAEVPLAYSKGYNPRPRISIAFPLAVGIVGENEIMDVFLEPPMAPLDLAKTVRRQLPAGATLLEVEEVYLDLPALQTQVQAAEYVVTVKNDRAVRDSERLIRALLERVHVPRERRGKVYNLRPLIEELRLEERKGDRYFLEMTLKAGEGGTGRPDEVLDELGLADRVSNVNRRRLLFSTARDGQT